MIVVGKYKTVNFSRTDISEVELPVYTKSIVRNSVGGTQLQKEAYSRSEDSEAPSIYDDKSVVFRGDGEPQNPTQLIANIANYEREHGIESDSYTLGGAVETLENKFAQELGKQSAIFMPTGTLANHLAIRGLCGSRHRAIVQERSHLYNDTGDCVQRLSGINMIPLGAGKTCFSIDELAHAFETSEIGRVSNSIGALMIESPVRRTDGRVVSFDDMKEITSMCRERGVGTHLDGARLYMMSAATGVSIRDYSDLFDTVYVSLYKYFGAPFGAILAGDADFIADMYHDRRMFGAGLSTSYLAAAAALPNIEAFEERFGTAMVKGQELFSELNKIDGLNVRPFKEGSNIFPLDLDSNIDIALLISDLKLEGIFLNTAENRPEEIMLATNTTILRQENKKIMQAFARSVERSRKDA